MGAYRTEVTLQVSACRSISVRYKISLRARFLLISKGIWRNVNHPHSYSDRCPLFNADLVYSDIKAGLGLVHDDINPRNDDGHGTIIDFDSWAYIGAKSRGGMPGWSTCPTTAQVENDGHGLNLIVKYIRGKYDGRGLDAILASMLGDICAGCRVYK